MNKNGDIIVIEDDQEDQEIITMVFEEIFKEHNFTNRLVILEDSSKVIKYLTDHMANPFMVISDINMPKIDGFALRKMIYNHPELSGKCIPYIFLTTSGENNNSIIKAYGMSIQGYFVKPSSFNDFKTLLTQIILYWKLGTSPIYY